MKHLEGKKLLFLGSNVGVTDMMRYARENGAWSIVADWYPTEKSPVKQTADEAVLISTADIGALCSLIDERMIDGVFAGINEFNILNAMKIAELCGMPFYCSIAQWDCIERKDYFRALCERYSVPCPKTYFTGEIENLKVDGISYPAVVKPVDASTSKGVHICFSEQELRALAPDAAASSVAGRVIVEEFVEGYEFTAHYTIFKGAARLACIDNRYPVAVHEGAVTTIPVARVYPSLFAESFIAQVDSQVTTLCESLGIDYGVVFIQGIYDENEDSFVIFEAGLRSAGEAPYRFIEQTNGINYMDMFVDVALGVEPQYDQSMEDPYLSGKCCGVVSFVGRGGTVGSIEGLAEAVAATSSVIDYEIRYPVGSVVPDGDTLRQLLIRFVMVCEDRAQMAKDIEFLNSSVRVVDVEGKNMAIKMDPERIFGLA